MEKKNIYIDTYGEEPNPRLKYTLSFIANHPFLKERISFTFQEEENSIHLLYNEKADREFDYFVPQQNSFFAPEKDNIHFPFFINGYSYLNKDYPGITVTSTEPTLLLERRAFAFDIFESIFFCISRYEEVFANIEDIGRAGWLKEELHLLVKSGFNKQPVVDEMINLLCQIWLGKNEAYKTTYSISHDIDILQKFKNPFYFLRSLAATTFYGRGVRLFVRTINWFFSSFIKKVKDPYDYFDELFVKEDLWMQKVVYLMSGGNTKYDNKYRLEDKKLEEVVELARKRGYEFGLHPSYNAAFDNRMFRIEKEKLEHKLSQAITQNRQHWLRFNWDKTPYLYDEIGIEVDSSMGYNTRLGFRCGTGFPYHLYDFKNEKAFVWQEQPMAFMESAAMHQVAREGQSLLEVMRKFILKNKSNTHITFNFHNSNFDALTDDGQELRRFYKAEFLDLLE